jgi:hypothetical protein
MQYLKSYQEKNKIRHLLPNFFFLLKNNKPKKQQRHAYGKEKKTSNPSM